jgi:hypothetical protein
MSGYDMQIGSDYKGIGYVTDDQIGDIWRIILLNRHDLTGISRANDAFFHYSDAPEPLACTRYELENRWRSPGLDLHVRVLCATDRCSHGS